jgi:hypothetical protein
MGVEPVEDASALGVDAFGPYFRGIRHATGALAARSSPTRIGPRRAPESDGRQLPRRLDGVARPSPQTVTSSDSAAHTPGSRAEIDRIPRRHRYKNGPPHVS